MKAKSKTIEFALAAATFLAASNSMAETTLERARATGSITIGISTEVPFSFIEAGQPAGADVVVFKHVASKLGIHEVRAVLSEFSSLIPGLQADRFDVIVAGMYVKPNRCTQVLFTTPMHAQGDAVVTLSGNSKGITSYKSIAADPTIKIGYIAGGTGVGANLTASGISPGQISTYQDNLAGVAALKAGRINAYASTSVIVQTLLNKLNDPTVERVRPFEQPLVDGKTVVGFGAFAVRKGDEDLRDALNVELKKYLGTPEHLNAVGPFNLSSDEIVPALAAETDRLCSE
ncbi:ectoine/hydroxyectoine ABC transporter substrate-binding protein EhuB [Rhizobium hainanense]|uniref:Polar amino acid transport system substrate-binding protein n=1 Tax=Rhizobium hainanense TaxID=52131 RepID=A0A1C3WCI9_9HYPH|nr:ectoine/hydroxyectoine ABC transporter substrate-binding protein EhuB [Rhizobium hainanense]SCB37663.1 polar amino acid transport system substrate-binding protein [Rhizobium hainanense]